MAHDYDLVSLDLRLPGVDGPVGHWCLRAGCAY